MAATFAGDRASIKQQEIEEQEEEEEEEEEKNERKKACETLVCSSG
jgi:hypothetical protein